MSPTNVLFRQFVAFCLVFAGVILSLLRLGQLANLVRSIFCWRIRRELRANGNLRLCSYALHKNTVPIWCASVALSLLRRLRLCARDYNNTPKGFSCELFAFLELRRVGWHCCP